MNLIIRPLSLLLLAGMTLLCMSAIPPKEARVTIDYNQKEIKLNDLVLDGSVSQDTLRHFLGLYDKIVVEAGYSNYFYDEHGLLFITNENTGRLYGMVVQFSASGTEFSLENNYKGKLTVNERRVNPFKGMAFMERLIKDISPRDQNGYKLIGAIEEYKVEYIYSRGGPLQLIYVNFP